MASTKATTVNKSRGSKKAGGRKRPAGERTAHIRLAGRDATPRRNPRQERSRETVAVILQAAAEVITDQGYDRASTNRIARRAGVSIGSLYQYFPNKESILAALHARHMGQIGNVVERFLVRLEDPDQPLADAMRALFRDLVSAHAVDPGLSRALSREAPHPVVTAPHEGEAAMARVEKALRNRPEIRVRDYAVATHLLGQATGSLSRWLVHDAPDDLNIDAFIEDAVAMLCGYALG